MKIARRCREPIAAPADTIPDAIRDEWLSPLCRHAALTRQRRTTNGRGAFPLAQSSGHPRDHMRIYPQIMSDRVAIIARRCDPLAATGDTLPERRRIPFHKLKIRVVILRSGEYFSASDFRGPPYFATFARARIA
jgi:hypothetical protein